MDLWGQTSPIYMGFRGWIFDRENPKRRLKLVLSVNGKVVEKQRVSIYREPLHRDGTHPTGKCGFRFDYSISLLNNGDMVDLFEPKTGFRLPGFPLCYTSKQVFFMHIPKTAGSALNEYVADSIGKPNVRLHIEGLISKNAQVESCQKQLFVSGHVRIHRILRLLDLSGFYKITLFRDPYRQLLSHLRWVRRLAEPENQYILDRRSESLRQLVANMNTFNLESPKEVARFASALTGTGLQFFDNCQTRYLLPRSVQQPLTSADLADAIESLKIFDLVGTNDGFENFLARLRQHTGWRDAGVELKKVNVHSNHFGLNPEDPELKEALRPLFSKDAALYDHVKKLENTQQATQKS